MVVNAIVYPCINRTLNYPPFRHANSFPSPCHSLTVRYSPRRPLDLIRIMPLNNPNCNPICSQLVTATTDLSNQLTDSARNDLWTGKSVPASFIYCNSVVEVLYAICTALITPSPPHLSHTGSLPERTLGKIGAKWSKIFIIIITVISSPPPLGSYNNLSTHCRW